MLGRHANRHQRNTILAVAAIVVATLAIAWITWPGGSAHTPTRDVQNAASGPQYCPCIVPATTTTTTVTSRNHDTMTSPARGVNPPLSAAGIATKAAPTSAGSPTQTGTTSGTVTTSNNPPTTVAIGSAGTGQTVAYAAYVDPRYTQDPANPLKVSYAYSADASTVVNGATVCSPYIRVRRTGLDLGRTRYPTSSHDYSEPTNMTSR